MVKLARCTVAVPNESRTLLDALNTIVHFFLLLKKSLISFDEAESSFLMQL